MNLTESWKHMMELFPLKLLGGVILSEWQGPLLTFGAFFLLVFVDCFTRWLALSHKALVEAGEAHPTLWDLVQYLGTARRLGYINSRVMKRQGVSKLVLYNLAILTAGAADWLISVPLMEGKWVDLVTSYLAMTEVLSIWENLSEAGVEGIEKLKKYRG